MASLNVRSADSTQNTPAPRRRALTLLLPVGSVTLAAGALLVAGMVTSTPTPSVAAGLSASAIARLIEPELHDVDRELRRVGLEPEALAAAGLDGAATTALANRAVSHLDGTTYASLRQALEAHGSAKATLHRLQRDFKAGTQGEATQQDLDDAIAAEASTRDTLETLQDALYDAATDGLGGEALGRLARIHAEADLAYPDYFKVVERTHDQAIALRDALNGVRIDTKLGHEPSDHHQSVINAQLADPAIAAAKDRYTANLDAVRAAWEGVFQPE